MKKYYKKVIIMALLALSVSAVAMSGCGGESTTIENDAKIETSSEKSNIEINPIDISKIEWSISKENIYGKNIASFNYTNNSQYDIVDVNLRMERKDTTNDKTLKSTFEEFSNRYSNYEMENFYLDCHNGKLSKPSETVTTSPILICGSESYYVNDEKALDLFEPKNLYIEFVGPDGNLYGQNYWYQTEVTNDPYLRFETNKWEDGILSSELPKPNAEYFVYTTNEDNNLFVRIYGVTENDYNNYIKECEKAGYIDGGNIDGREDNLIGFYGEKDNHHLTIYYNEASGFMSINIFPAN